MAKKQKRWARVERARLRLILGNACRWCGCETRLEFDCIIPQGDGHHRMDTQMRIIFYRKQLAQSNLQLLCNDCHKKKNRQDAAKQDNIPF